MKFIEVAPLPFERSVEVRRRVPDGSASTPANSGVAAGACFKVMVDAKGRVPSGAWIASGDVAVALGYTPANEAGESFIGSTSVTGTITVSGYITAYSDASLKAEVETIPKLLELIQRLRGVSVIRLQSAPVSVTVDNLTAGPQNRR